MDRSSAIGHGGHTFDISIGHTWPFSTGWKPHEKKQDSSDPCHHGGDAGHWRSDERSSGSSTATEPAEAEDREDGTHLGRPHESRRRCPTRRDVDLQGLPSSAGRPRVPQGRRGEGVRPEECELPEVRLRQAVPRDVRRHPGRRGRGERLAPVERPHGHLDRGAPPLPLRARIQRRRREGVLHLDEDVPAQGPHGPGQHDCGRRTGRHRAARHHGDRPRHHAAPDRSTTRRRRRASATPARARSSTARSRRRTKADFKTPLPKFKGTTLPYAVCGYTGPQFRAAYSRAPPLDGTGVTVAITDAYAAPTIAKDAQRYAHRQR